MNWGLTHYIALDEHISEELSRMLTTVDIIWYLKICRHCVSSIHRIVGYTQTHICWLEVSPWMHITSPSRSHHDLANYYECHSTMTWLTITEFTVGHGHFPLSKSCLLFCACTKPGVYSHIIMYCGGIYFTSLCEVDFGLCDCSDSVVVFALNFIPRSWFSTEYVYSQAF